MYKYMDVAYAYIDGNFYKTDCKELDIRFYKKKSTLKNLKYFNNLEVLSLSFASEEVLLENIGELKQLKKLSIRNSCISDWSFINSLPNIEELYILQTNIDFSCFENTNIKKISVLSCEVYNIEKINIFCQLDEICLFNIDSVDLQSFSTLKNIKSLYLGKINEIKNIQTLSALTSVEKLTIYGSNVNINNIMLYNLPNLKYLIVSEDMINNEEKNILREKGINVKIYTEK